MAFSSPETLQRAQLRSLTSSIDSERLPRASGNACNNPIGPLVYDSPAFGRFSAPRQITCVLSKFGWPSACPGRQRKTYYCDIRSCRAHRSGPRHCEQQDSGVQDLPSNELDIFLGAIALFHPARTACAAESHDRPG